jgi:hypothetical protein
MTFLLYKNKRDQTNKRLKLRKGNRSKLKNKVIVNLNKVRLINKYKLMTKRIMKKKNKNLNNDLCLFFKEN